ncbi:MAG: peptidylprolyl isomerase [Planctomycetota bacterium]
MRSTHITLTCGLCAAVLIGQLAGCAWVKQRWPWSKKEVPVTEPERTADWVEVDLERAGSTRPSERAPAPTRPVTAPRTQSAPAVATRPRRRPEAPQVPPEAGEVVAGVLLRVNERFYTVEDVVRLAGPRLAELSDDLPPGVWRIRARDILSQAMRDEVGQVLVAAEAEAHLTETQEQMVTDAVAERRKELVAESGGSELMLRRELQQKGTTLEAALDRYRRSLIAQSYLQSKFRPRIDVTRRDLWLYYRRHREEFSTPKQVQMQIIAAPFAAFDPEAGDPRDQARTVIERARADLEAGRSFDAVARARSRGVKAEEGGIWPMMPQGNFRIEPVEQAAFELPPGGVSDVVATDEGFYIVKAQKVRPARTVPFADAQAEIRQRIRRKRHEKLVQQYYRRLSENAVIVRNEELMDAAVRRAQKRFYNPQAN